MTDKQTFDVIVIGGGIVGCSTACSLAGHGIEVAVVEADAIGQGTSSNTFAWINATSKASDEAYHRLNALGASRYRELACEWGERRIGLHPSGMLEWSAPADEARLREIRERANRLAELGYPIARVDDRDLRAMEPHVEFPDGAEGLHAFADAWLDVPTHLRFLAERLAASGGVLYEHCRALELDADDEGAVRGLVTQQGKLLAEHVVVATGPGTPEVLSALTGYDAFAARFPMQQAPGLLVTTPGGDPRQLARHILYTSDPNHLHIRATTDGGLLLGADDTDGLISQDASASGMRRAAAELLERTHRLIPGFPGASLVDRCRLGIGVRPMPADGRSIAGPMPSAQGLHVVLTHSGVTLAPALGTLVAQTIESGTVASQLEPFGVDRFQAFH